MEQKDIQEAIKLVRKGSKERKFKQTLDIVVNFKDLDLKNPAHKFKAEVVLPHGRGKPIKIAAFADGATAENAKKAGIEKILDKTELSKLATNKKETRTIANGYDFFVAQTDFMVDIGKILGAVLGPRNKMPQPVPPNVPLDAIVKRLEKLVRIRIVNQPLIHCRVGTEEMSDEQLVANIDAILSMIYSKTPKHEENIRSVCVKTTMGKSIKIGAPVKADDGGEEQ